ncbi:MAG: type II toxin-antitoxin system VapC family toxin [Chloroflexota bacterium]|nr:type II toxin-antitoxin system VapC family toxin [Chloroflexota bacterium]
MVKRYSNEAGSNWIRTITDPISGHAIFLAEITLAEVAAALAAKQRAPQGISLATRDRALGRFLSDCAEHFLLLRVDREVIAKAVELTQLYRLRGYDAVQLATIVVAGADLLAHDIVLPLFVAADRDLLLAAQGEGFSVSNPLTA